MTKDLRMTSFPEGFVFEARNKQKTNKQSKQT
jgi:hypothetical protein